MLDPKRNLWKTKMLSKSEEVVLFEQYKLYVEMMDKISERRDKANAFFLTLNIGIVTIAGYLWDKKLPLEPGWIVVLPVIISLGFCRFWFLLIKSYRQLNGAKLELIGDLEQKLPARLWFSEWRMLGEGNDPTKYKSLSKIEQNLPIWFAILYIASAFIYFFR